LFEARLLPGHLEFKEAVRLYLSGNTDGAAEHASEADRHYAEAERVAESSIDAYLGRCGVSGLMLHMIQHRLAADPVPIYARADESCSRAVVVEPDNAEAHRMYSDAVRNWANLQVENQKDPGTAYVRAADLIERAIALSPDDLEAILTLADTFLDRAWWENKSDKDPRGALTQAVATYERALGVDPRNITAANNMGQALLLRSRFEAAHGLDASQSQDRCIATLQRALRVDPSLAPAFRVLARAAVERADEQTRRGVDARPGLQQVLQFIDQLGADGSPPTRVAAVSALRARLDGR
jgi:tetratricopeptide (TPR) repeat protein